MFDYSNVRAVNEPLFLTRLLTQKISRKNPAECSTLKISILFRSRPRKTRGRGTHPSAMGSPTGSKVQGKVFDTKRNRKTFGSEKGGQSQFKPKVFRNRGRNMLSHTTAQKKREGTRKGLKEKVSPPDDQKSKNQPRKFWATEIKSSMGGFPHPLLPTTLRPAPLGRSTEDAFSAARARSGALGSKASGCTLRGKAGREPHALPPLI